MLAEINFDGLIGASHNYAGLSLGNLAAIGVGKDGDATLVATGCLTEYRATFGTASGSGGTVMTGAERFPLPPAGGARDLPNAVRLVAAGWANPAAPADLSARAHPQPLPQAGGE